MHSLQETVSAVPSAQHMEQNSQCKIMMNN
jgi:hypothetical protein